VRTYDSGQQPPDLIARQYDGESLGALGAYCIEVRKVDPQYLLV
jgi:hypothetical protein